MDNAPTSPQEDTALDRDARANAVRQRYLRNTYDKIEEFADEPSQRLAEQRILGCITLGNAHVVEEVAARMAADPAAVPANWGLVEGDSLQQARYGLAASVTLMCRTAIDAGLPEALAYRMSDAYIRELDLLGSLADGLLLFTSALCEYCDAVRDWRLSACRPELRRCCAYVCLHLHDRVTLDDLCAQAGLSKSRLSDLFLDELGMRPAAYVRAQKLAYACFILDNFDTPVGYIASLLAFPSASAFVQQFKQAYGTTPSRYRRRAR